MADELASHDRYAGQYGDLFLLDELQGCPGIPLVHVHQLAACQRASVRNAVVCGDVKQRRGHECCGGQGGCRILGRLPFAFGKRPQYRRPKTKTQDVGYTTAMREQGTLWLSGRARGIEDAGITVGIDGNRGHFAAKADDVRPPDDVSRHITHAHRDHCHIVDLISVGEDWFETLCVAYEHLGLCVRQGEDHFRPDPPSVHADDYSADRHGCPVRNQPLGIVAHRDGHMIARANAFCIQPIGNGRDIAVSLGVSPPFIFVNQVVAFSELTARQPNIPEARRRRRIGLDGDATDLRLGDLERRTGCREFGPNLTQLIVHSPTPVKDAMIRAVPHVV